MLAWIDLETTGLDPREHQLLEIAIVITDNDLEAVDEFTRVIKPAKQTAVGFRSAMPTVVRTMHQRSGLLNDVASAPKGRGVAAVEAEVRVFMEEHFGPADPNIRKRPYMCGSSVHFDRAFIEVHMPALDRHFHYRNFDATTIGEAARMWYPDQFEEVEKRQLHRALPDLYDTLAELRYIRGTFFR